MPRESDPWNAPGRWSELATTHWSEVARCALTDVPSATDALAQLCETYWPPIYSFIRGKPSPPRPLTSVGQGLLAQLILPALPTRPAATAPTSAHSKCSPARPVRSHRVIGKIIRMRGR